jgi:DNA-binding NtrC family response regulator
MRHAKRRIFIQYGNSMACILLIDDEADVRLFHRILLEELDGYEVIEAGSGAAAKEVLSQKEIDAVVLDFQARDIDGPQFLNDLRARQPEVAIIIDTGNNRFRDYFANVAAEAIVYKSCGFPDLEKALHQIMVNKSLSSNF